jgi:hypothetical protein
MFDYQIYDIRTGRAASRACFYSESTALSAIESIRSNVARGYRKDIADMVPFLSVRQVTSIPLDNDN